MRFYKGCVGMYSLPKNHPLPPPKEEKKSKLSKHSEKKFYSKTLKNKQKLLKRGRKIVAFDRDV